MSAWGGRILGVCLAMEEAVSEGEWRQSTRSRGLTWEAAVSLREVKRQWRLLKAPPPHKAPSRSMITLSGGGREDARREDTQRGHLRDKRRFFSSSKHLGTKWKSDNLVIFFFQLGLLFTVVADIRAALCLSIITDAKADDGRMG